VDYMVGAQLDGFDTMVHLQMRMTRFRRRWVFVLTDRQKAKISFVST
jgi:hypothetical protein